MAAIGAVDTTEAEVVTFIPIADMKSLRLLLLASWATAGLQFGLAGCVVRPGRDDGVYYDDGTDRGPWFRDGAWADGRGWYGGHESADVGISIYPGR